MLAIGRGARQEILDQMRLLGANNVIITPIVERAGAEAVDENDRVQPKRVSPGLSVRDVRSILATVPQVEAASGEIVLETAVGREGRRRPGRLVGVDGPTSTWSTSRSPPAAGSRPRTWSWARPWRWSATG
jgi:putative ABC transport system permease protein